MTGRRVGYLTGPAHIVADMVADPMWIHRVGDKPSVQREVAQLLHEVGLKPEWGRNFSFQFSGGQRQRIGIARALAISRVTVHKYHQMAAEHGYLAAEAP